MGMKDETILQRRWMRWVLSLGAWTLIGFLFASQSRLSSLHTGMAMKWTDVLFWEIPRWSLWAMLSPLILRLTRRYGFDRGQARRNALIHILAGLLISFVHVALATIGTLILDFWWYGWPVDAIINKSLPLAATRFQLYFTFDFHVGFLIYWIILILHHAFAYYRRVAQMQAQITQAQLQALKMQLQPHFLFNTLHAISAYMYEDVEVADRMLTRLSELLRLTLENVGVQEVPLRQELEFLERYLEIERARFEERLTVKMDIAPESLEARVPNLVLQPLVENAIRHGISPRAQAGRIEIHAKRENGMLFLQVRDNGPGLPENEHAPRQEGIGLTNTRARLQHLYGAAHRLELRNAAEGGLLVSLTIPFRTASEMSIKNE